MIHLNGSVEHRFQSGIGAGMIADGSGHSFSAFQSDNRTSREAGQMCSFCHKRGHLEADCYRLKSGKNANVSASQLNGAGLAAPNWFSIGLPVAVDPGMQVKHSGVAALEFYLVFVKMGYVSMVGSKQKVPLNI